MTAPLTPLSELTPLSALVGLVAEARRGRALTVVGIGGHGASGKTTLARALAAATDAVQVVSTDSFWNGSQFDLGRLRTEVLDELLAGRDAVYDEWDWAARRANGRRTVRCTGIVVVEGVCALHRMFRDDEQVRVWVEAPAQVRLERGVARDGASMRATWTDVWMPNEDAYVRADEPVACAHLVVDGTRPFT
jgi:uridine kinase